MALQVLEIAPFTARSFNERWERIGISSVRAPIDRALELIRAPASRESIFDAVVIRITHSQDDPATNSPESEEAALLLVDEIRSLPSNVAMFDGKQWRSIPIVLTTLESESFAEGFSADDGPARDVDARFVVAVPHQDNNYGGDLVRKTVESYREAVLSELDSMGFIVQYDRGRYRVSAALKPREELEGRYYFGPGDLRPAGYVTVYRENFGIQVEVEEFEALINRADVSERELQTFFERNPHFLSESHTPLPQVRLSKPDGSLLIPDFILKPIVAQQRDSRWEVLDLKLPQERLLAGRGSRARLSSAVMSAIRQLRDYKEHLEHPAHAREIKELLGHSLRRPQLGVLIGRLANTDVEVLEREQQYLRDVKIVTYDEILEEQRSLIVR